MPGGSGSWCSGGCGLVSYCFDLRAEPSVCRAGPLFGVTFLSFTRGERPPCGR